MARGSMSSSLHTGAQGLGKVSLLPGEFTKETAERDGELCRSDNSAMELSKGGALQKSQAIQRESLQCLRKKECSQKSTGACPRATAESAKAMPLLC